MINKAIVAMLLSLWVSQGWCGIQFQMCYDTPPDAIDRMVFPTLLDPGVAQLRRVAGNQFESYHVCVERGILVYCATGEPLAGRWARARNGIFFLIDLRAHRRHLRQAAMYVQGYRREFVTYR